MILPKLKVRRHSQPCLNNQSADFYSMRISPVLAGGCKGQGPRCNKMFKKHPTHAARSPRGLPVPEIVYWIVSKRVVNLGLGSEPKSGPVSQLVLGTHLCSSHLTCECECVTPRMVLLYQSRKGDMGKYISKGIRVSGQRAMTCPTVQTLLLSPEAGACNSRL